MDFHAEVTRAYRRWHALERALGKEGGLVLDFDMAADVGPCPAYPDREAARRELSALLAALPPDLVNREFVAAKLDGALAYVEALLGERAPFAAYLRRTMGIDPVVVPEGVLAAQRAALEADFAARGIPFSTAGRAAFTARYGVVRGDQVGDPLREHARRFVARALALVEGDAAAFEPEYRVEVVAEDAYWSNWIDGSADGGVLLRINTHERIEYNAFSAESLAAHEIAGHAVHVASLRRSASRGGLDACALNLAVHSCEAFQMEGLAQLALVVLADPGRPTPEDLALLERHRDYASARIDNAQIAMEAGASMEEAVAGVLADCPLVRPISVESGLRDRGRSPLFRSYIHVYGPARRLFARAADLPEPARSTFYREAWTTLRTPDQLAARLAELAPAAATA